MSSKDVSRTFKMPMRLWIVNIIESGNYNGLVWTDESKTCFKLPWLKKDYPGWKDCESIVRAWADHQGRSEKEGAKSDFSTLKANFRNALRKSDDFEEIKEQSQLDHQMNNFKVYKILPPEEVRRKTGEKLRKRKKVLSESSQSSKVLCSDHNLDDGKKKTMNTKKDLDSLLAGQACSVQSVNYLLDERSTSLQSDSIQKEFLNPDLVQHNVTLLRKQIDGGGGYLCSGQTSTISPEEISCEPPTQYESSHYTTPHFYSNTSPADTTKTQSLHSRQIAQVTVKLNEPQSLIDRLVECGIQQTKAHECTLVVSYNSMEVLCENLQETIQGYRICFGDQEKLTGLLEMQHTTHEEMSDYQYPQIKLPNALPGCEMFSKILDNTDLGVVFRYDPITFSFYMKRLCQCQVFYLNPHSDVAEKKPIKIDRREEVCLFSYGEYLSRFLLQCESEQGGFTLPQPTMVVSIGSKSNLMPEKHSPNGLRIEITPNELKHLNEEFTRSENVSLYFSAATPVEELLRQLKCASIEDEMQY